MQQYSPGGFRILPTVVKNLLIINGLFYLAIFALGTSQQLDLVDLLGLHYPASEKFAPYQFITYMFLHSPHSLMHIFFNMFALWMFGSAIENVWGPKRFLIFYLITGVGAAITHYTVQYFDIQPTTEQISMILEDPSMSRINSFLNSPHFVISSNEMATAANLFVSKFNQLHMAGLTTESQHLAIDFFVNYKIAFLNSYNVVGASGAVFGLLLAFGMLFPNSLIYLYFFIPIRAKYFVILFGILELISGVAQTGDNVAHFAHLGGMVFGFFLILFWKKKKNIF
jgi:membrane associated rhomboid family serine protease